MKYPREVGSNKVVHENDWNQNALFGHCPACGSIGVEELHCPGDEDICFYCSDPTCKTIQDGRNIPMQTKWTTDKPDEMQKRERKSGWSWNQEHWPNQTLPVACFN